MVMRQSSKSKALFASAVLAVIIAALLCSTFFGQTHKHGNLASHKDCSACLWQASSFLLLLDIVLPACIAAVAFLRMLQCPLPLPSTLRGQLSVRAPPPYSLA
jgi:hypothetical protein